MRKVSNITTTSTYSIPRYTSSYFICQPYFLHANYKLGLQLYCGLRFKFANSQNQKQNRNLNGLRKNATDYGPKGGCLISDGQKENALSLNHKINCAFDKHLDLSDGRIKNISVCSVHSLFFDHQRTPFEILSL